MLAHFERPSEIARTVTAEYGVDVDRFQVRSYDPTKPNFAAGERWRAIFNAARAAYLDKLDAIPIAHKAFRLNELQRNYMRARDAGNLVLANATIEQAAKEMGGALTNERNINVKSAIEEMTPEERRSQFANLIRRALETDQRVRGGAAS